MNYAYIRVSKISQDLENQKNAIYEFTNKNKLFIDEFIEIKISSRSTPGERRIDEILSKVQKDDTLIVSELSRLGRSVSEVMNIVNILVDKGVRLICIKESIDLKDRHSIQSKVMITMISLFAELERDLISQRTKEALAQKKANGMKLGRPTGISSSKLDVHKKAIIDYLNKGVSISSIAKILEVKYSTLLKYLRKHKIKK